MGFFQLLLLFVASAIVSILLRPKIKDTSSPGDFRPPEPREGQPIAVVFGTALVSPAVTWFGDVEAKRVNKTVSSLFGLVQDKVPLGYEYYAGMQLLLCHGPIDELLDIYIGEHRVVRQAKYVGEGIGIPSPEGGWPEPYDPSLPVQYENTPTRVSLNLPNLFGGPEEGGGVVGQFDIHWGDHTQGQNDYLGIWWGVDILPQYRDLAYVVLRRMNMGKSPSPAPWKFVIKRIPSNLTDPDFSEIGDGTANGAEIIYELLTDANWGLGKPTSTIDKDSFDACAETLSDEGLGYSGVMSDRSEAWQKITDIRNHVNGVVYQDPLSGLIAMKLIRDDYTIANLVELDETNCVIEEYTRGSWAEVVNETAVTFTDAARRFTEAVAQAQNLASIQAMDGEIVSNSVSLPGLTTHELAQIATERLNRSSSVPLVRLRIRTNRIAYGFHQGMPFKVTYPELDLDEMVCRVVTVNYGSLTDGMIEIDALQDAWDVSDRVYASPDDLVDLEPCGPLSLLVTDYDPATNPTEVYGYGVTKIFEAPYWHVGAKGRAWVHQGRASNQDLSWECWYSLMGLEMVKHGRAGYFSPTGVLINDALLQSGDFTGITIEVKTQGDMNFLTGTDNAGLWAGSRLLMIDDEIMAWRDIADMGNGVYQISGILRGQLDTVPEDHYVTSKVYFYYSDDDDDTWNAFDVSGDAAPPFDLDPFTQVNVYPTIVAPDGTTKDPTTVPVHGVMVAERASAPYPPGNIQASGVSGYNNWPSTHIGDLTITWSYRSRTEQTTMVAWDDPQQYTQEGTLTVEILLDGESVREWTSVTATEQEYTWAQRLSDDADTTKKVQYRITPIGTGDEVGTVVVTPPITMQAP